MRARSVNIAHESTLSQRVPTEITQPERKRSKTRGSTYDARHTAGVFPIALATSLMTCAIARLRAVLDPAVWTETAIPRAAMAVAAQVRKSLALKSRPVISLM